MTAVSLQVVTDVVSNPEWQTSLTIRQINANISFTFQTNTIRTLSANPADAGQPFSGLLYVPTLDSDDPCVAASAPWVPHNVTRADRLPPIQSEKWVAIAPWVSQNCTMNYLLAANEGNPVSTFLVFLPNNSTDAPPPVNSAVWNIQTGTNNNPDAWKEDFPFPVYAISGANGMTLMDASAQYSGNMTDVPYGHTLTEYYDSRDYVRLFVDISTEGGGGIPSLWIFLVVVLGIMLGIIGSISLLMHWVQMRRRRSLRRRVANGEVDLEALGIKRLTVPQEVLDEMPLYIYGSGKPAKLPHASSSKLPVEVVEGEEIDGSPPSTRPSSPTLAIQPAPVTRRKPAHRPTTLQQPTCAICLDDFVAPTADTPGTVVREMPCQHIFHPECVDTFLRDSSSLCPMCKKTALPTGYCPRTITNAMVRRERMVRRLRPRADSRRGNIVDNLPPLRTNRSSSWDALRGFSTFNARRISEAWAVANNVDATEMTAPAVVLVRENTATSPQPTEDAVHPPVQPSASPSRREWARQRAVAMLGRRDAPVDPDAEEQRTIPAWRRGLRGVFPGFGREPSPAV